MKERSIFSAIDTPPYSRFSSNRKVSTYRGKTAQSRKKVVGKAAAKKQTTTATAAKKGKKSSQRR